MFSGADAQIRSADYLVITWPASGLAEELTFATSIGYSDDGQLVGHIARAVVWIDRKADAAAARTFGQIAQITAGACCPFDRNSAQQLKDLLSAVAVYAAGGYKALEDFHQRKGGVVLQLMRKNS